MEKEQGHALIIAAVWPTQVWWSKLLTPDSHPFNTSTSEGPAYSSSCGGSTLPKEPASYDGLSLVREHYRTKSISGTAVSLLMQSWRAGTRSQYSCYLKTWAAFCTKREVNSFQPSTKECLDFSSELYSQGLAYCAINNAISALSIYITVNDGKNVGQHPLVKRLISPDHQSQNTRRYGMFKLNYLGCLHLVETLTLKQITLKMVILLLLVTCQRGQTIRVIDLGSMFGSKDSHLNLFLQTILSKTNLAF